MIQSNPVIFAKTEYYFNNAENLHCNRVSLHSKSFNRQKESKMKDNNRKITSSRIWQECSHIRGVMPDTQMQQVVIAFTFLRRIDCIIGKYAEKSQEFYQKNYERLSDETLDKKLRDISGGYSFYNYSGYTLSNILLSNNSIEVVLNTYLQGFSKNVQEILAGMEFQQNLGILYRQSKYIVELFQLFSEMDLSNATIDNEEFIELVSSVFSLVGGLRISQFYSSLELSNLIGECLFSNNVCSEKNNIVSIYDPVCGTGSMLAVAGEKAKTIVTHQDNISLNGQELAVFPCAIAKGLVLLSGNENSQVLYGNTLTDDFFPNSHFQYIVADMPLGLQWRPFKERIENESFDVKGRFHIGLPNVTDSQFLFIEHILSKMDVKGSRAAFITNSFVLWGGNAASGESRIRRWMFENDLVETIIALPSGMLAATNIPVYLWILSNKKNQDQKGRVCLIDLTIQEEKGSRISIGEGFVKSAVSLYKSWSNSPMSKIVNNEQFGFYEVNLLEDGKKKETVTISLDTDINEFVAKERQPYAKGEITVDYSSVEKGFAIQFNEFFQTEEIDIPSLKDASSEMAQMIDAISSMKGIIEESLNLKENYSVPQNWREFPLRAVVEVTWGINRPPVPSDNGSGLPVLSVPYLRNPSNEEQHYSITPQTKCATHQDVLIIVKGANTGEIFKGIEGILPPSLASIRCANEDIVVPQYLYYLLKGYEKALMSQAKGSTIKSLVSKTILDLKCWIPTIDEQLRLVSYLDKVIGKIDSVAEVLGNAGNVFSEYRQTLIENVVHGRALI